MTNIDTDTLKDLLEQATDGPWGYDRKSQSILSMQELPYTQIASVYCHFGVDEKMQDANGIILGDAHYLAARGIELEAELADFTSERAEKLAIMYNAEDAKIENQAATIERLTKALENIKNWSDIDDEWPISEHTKDAVDIHEEAKAALAGKEGE